MTKTYYLDLQMHSHGWYVVEKCVEDEKYLVPETRVYAWKHDALIRLERIFNARAMNSNPTKLST